MNSYKDHVWVYSCVNPIVYLGLTGEAFFIVERDSERQVPREIWVCHPGRFKEVLDAKTGLISGWVYGKGVQKIPISPPPRPSASSSGKTHLEGRHDLFPVPLALLQKIHVFLGKPGLIITEAAFQEGDGVGLGGSAVQVLQLGPHALIFLVADVPGSLQHPARLGGVLKEGGVVPAIPPVLLRACWPRWRRPKA